VAGVSGKRVRARPAPSSRRAGDEPLTVDPGRDGRLEAFADGRFLLVPSSGGGRRTVVMDEAVTADGSGARRIEVVVDGWRFEVDVESERRAELREKAGRERAGAGRHASAEVRAMIPGRVVAVSVARGDEVTAGQELLVVEAMKMQNEVRAPLAGIVQQLAVGAGQTVELGELLVVIEAGSVGIAQ
jgi:biotin carboxyl carrier protein